MTADGALNLAVLEKDGTQRRFHSLQGFKLRRSLNRSACGFSCLRHTSALAVLVPCVSESPIWTVGYPVEVSAEKYESELSYWYNRKQIETELQNAHYEELMLRLAQVNKTYFAGKVVGDFGCGPRGSLEWMDEAQDRYGIDVLVDQYLPLGIERHKMKYVKCTERSIPLEDEVLDVLFSINSIDHASDPDEMLNECFRIVKAHGLVAMSINLDEPASASEPNTLTKKWVSERVASRIAVRHFAVSPRHPSGNKYRYLYDWSHHGTEIPPYNGSYGFCWITGHKK